MQKKLTITLDESIYEGLHEMIGRGKISQFIENLVRPYISGKFLDLAYSKMASEESREQTALEWCEGLIGDVSDEPR